MAKLDEIQVAKMFLNMRLIENVIVCDSPGDYATLRNTIEAQFLGRASAELLEQILSNADKIWSEVKGSSKRRQELADILQDWREGLAEVGIGSDDMLIEYICEKLNQERNLDNKGTV